MRLSPCLRAIALVLSGLTLLGCGDFRAARYNRSHALTSLESLLSRRPELQQATDDWKVTVDYTAAKLPNASSLAAFPIGNGEVFALTGLHYPLGSLENILGPTYQKTPGSFGQIVPVVYVGSSPAQWQRQESTWLRAGGVVRTVSTAADGLTLTIYDFALPRNRALLRVMELKNSGERQRLGPLSLVHIFTATNPEFARNEVRLLAGANTLTCGYLRSRASVLKRAALPYDPARAGRATALRVPEDAQGLRCPLGRLGPGESTVQVFHMIFTDATDDGSATREALKKGAHWLAEIAHAGWTRPSLQCSDRRLVDLLKVERYLMLVQQAAGGGFSPMHGYTKCWIRDSNGPVRYLLACGDYEAVKRYLDFQYKGYAEHGRVSNNLLLNLAVPAQAKPVDWSRVQVPAAEIASFMILQRYWYWKHTADHDLIREQWPLLRRCLLGQRVDEHGTLPFFGDETYRFPGYELFNARQPADDYVNMRLRSLDSAMEYVVAAEALAEMAPFVDQGGEGGEYRAAAERVRRATESLYWQEERKFYAPARSDLSPEVQQKPVAPINLHSWWLGYAGADARQINNLDAVLRYLAKPSGTVLTTPQFGYYVPMTAGYVLYALSAAGHPAREQALQGVLAAAEAGGGYAEMNTADDRPAETIWGQHRVRPWEGGINAEAVWYALTGWQVDVPGRRLALSPWLPEGMSEYTTDLDAGGEWFTLKISPTRCWVRRPVNSTDRDVAREHPDPYEVNLRFLTTGPTPQVTGDWRQAGGSLQVRSDAYGQKVILLAGVRLALDRSVEITFDPPLQPARAPMPERQPFTWQPPRAEWLRPVVLLTWDPQTVVEQRAKHGAQLTVADTKISWPTSYLRSWLFTASGARRARLVILDVAGWPGAFKRPEYWAEEGEGGRLLKQFQQAGGRVERVQTGREFRDEVVDI